MRSTDSGLPIRDPHVKQSPYADTNAYKITRPGESYSGPHIGPQLAKRLNTHRWHVLRIRFIDPQPESYEVVMAAKTITPHAIKKLLAKA